MTELAKNHRKEFTVSGVTVCAEISPCCWMYDGYPLQLKISSPGLRDVVLVKKGVSFKNASALDFDEICSRVKVEQCCNDGCANPRFAVSDDPHDNRGGQCENCFLEKLRAEFANDREKEEKRERRHDAKMYEHGHRFKITAWIHPKGGGGDYQVVFYSSAQPSDHEVRSELRNKSDVDNDYVIEELKPPAAP